MISMHIYTLVCFFSITLWTKGRNFLEKNKATTARTKYAAGLLCFLWIFYAFCNFLLFSHPQVAKEDFPFSASSAERNQKRKIDAWNSDENFACAKWSCPSVKWKPIYSECLNDHSFVSCGNDAARLSDVTAFRDVFADISRHIIINWRNGMRHRKELREIFKKWTHSMRVVIIHSWAQFSATAPSVYELIVARAVFRKNQFPDFSN